MWNKYYSILLMLPFILFIVSTFILNFGVGYTIILLHTVILGILYFSIGFFLSFKKKKFKILGFIFLIIYLLFNIFIGYFNNGFEAVSIIFAILVSIYYIIIYLIKNIKKYNN